MVSQSSTANAESPREALAGLARNHLSDGNGNGQASQAARQASDTNNVQLDTLRSLRGLMGDCMDLPQGGLLTSLAGEVRLATAGQTWGPSGIIWTVEAKRKAAALCGKARNTRRFGHGFGV